MGVQSIHMDAADGGGPYTGQALPIEQAKTDKAHQGKVST